MLDDIYNYPLRFWHIYTGIVAAYTETNNRCSKPCPFTFRGNVANDTILVTTLSGFDT